MLQALDKNNDGYISKAEFSNLAKTLPKEKVQLQCRRNFSYINWTFLQNFTKLPHLCSGAKIKMFFYFSCYITMIVPQVEAVMAKFDKDGDGKLDYEEFKKMIQKKKK